MRYVVFNRKGGVGKSTIVCNLAAVAAASGRRTLVVDLDPQGNASHYLLGTEPDPERTVSKFFESTLGFSLIGGNRPEQWVQPTPFERLSLMAADATLADLQNKLETKFKINKLRDQLVALEDAFEVVLIDTPPALSFFTVSALIAADRCLIPFDCDEFSRRALYQLLASVEEIRADHNPDLRVGGIVVNHYQAQAKLPRQMVEALIDEGLPVLQPYLSPSVKVRESHRAHQPLVHYDPKHRVAEQFNRLWQSVEAVGRQPPEMPALGG
ncbi:MAG: ParA family protein [Acidobacteriota bacterium]